MPAAVLSRIIVGALILIDFIKQINEMSQIHGFILEIPFSLPGYESPAMTLTSLSNLGMSSKAFDILRALLRFLLHFSQLQAVPKTK